MVKANILAWRENLQPCCGGKGWEQDKIMVFDDSFEHEVWRMFDQVIETLLTVLDSR